MTRTAAGYDYVIVGAGSAGCVLARRLTEDPDVRVLLLEAGGPDRHPLIHIPIGMGRMHKHRMFDWGYDSEPEPQLQSRRLEAMRGKVLGGSSSINVMGYSRGAATDYDRWARTAPGWSYADVLPYFRKAVSYEGDRNATSGDGPLGVQWSRTTDPIFTAWRQAAVSAGYRINHNLTGGDPEGFGTNQWTVRNGRRSSTATAYLKPVRGRRNLHVETHAHVTKVILSGTRAVGVEYVRHGRRLSAAAERETILSGGAFNTPQILMLSGIGPASHLREIGIKAVADLPVGENLQDHLSVVNFYRRLDQGEFHRALRVDRMAFHMLRAWLFRSGLATAIPTGFLGFIKTRAGLSEPDILFVFPITPPNADIWLPGRPYPDAFGLRPVLLHPRSRGRILLRSEDPMAPIRICFNFLSEPDDLATLREGFKRGRELAHQAAMTPHRGPEIAPGEAVVSDRDIDDYIRRTAFTMHHPSGTCKMGDDSLAVLDPQMRVRGIEGLRVVDASAMPDLISGSINACVIMMAEKAADLIRGRASVAVETDAA